MTTANNRGKSFKKFDLDLAFGEQWEDFIAEGLNTAEVKTEKDQWLKTGNLCIEYQSYGKPSGIEATESDLWVHNLTYDGELVMSFMIPTKLLKEVYTKGYQVSGGDHQASRIHLLKVLDLPKLIINKFKESI